MNFPDHAERLNEDDQAARAAERFTNGALLAQRRAAGGVSTPTGKCRNCEEACAQQAFYCDADCRADYERRNRAWKC